MPFRDVFSLMYFMAVADVFYSFSVGIRFDIVPNPGVLTHVYVLSMDSCEIGQCNIHVWILPYSMSI